MAASDQVAAADRDAKDAAEKSPTAEREAEGEPCSGVVFKRCVYRIVFQGRTVFRWVDDRGPTTTGTRASTLISEIPASLTREVPRLVPAWVQALAAADHNNDAHISFLMSKELTESDLDDRDNRLSIPADAAEDKIIPVLTDEERKAAVVRDHPKKKRRARSEDITGEGEPARRETRGGGLPVTVYTRSRWRFVLSLICLRSKKYGVTAAALEGKELEPFNERSFFMVGDQVEMWAFRIDGQLHLALGKSA